MTNETCILTAKDLSILEVMLDRCAGPDISMRSLLLRKIRSAAVVFMDEAPTDAATLNSRVRYRVDGLPPETRILSHAPEFSVVGMTLPVASRRGLALLGLRNGQSIVIPKSGGGQEAVQLEEVLFQPEAAVRARRIRDGFDTRVIRGVRLHVVANTRGGMHDAGGDRTALPPDGPEDAGPPAA
jgi:regulator of nucleoside diphosphate kinase